jgi:hypothetical protein
MLRDRAVDKVRDQGPGANSGKENYDSGREFVRRRMRDELHGCSPNLVNELSDFFQIGPRVPVWHT